MKEFVFIVLVLIINVVEVMVCLKLKFLKWICSLVDVFFIDDGFVMGFVYFFKVSWFVVLMNFLKLCGLGWF